jgi:hypothetical protein
MRVEMVGIVATCVGGWAVLSVAAAFGLGRAISIADRRVNRLRAVGGEKVQHVAVHRTVTLNTAQIPKISVQ